MMDTFTVEDIVMEILSDGKWHDMEDLALEMKIPESVKVTFGWILHTLYAYGIIIQKGGAIKRAHPLDNMVPYKLSGVWTN